MKRNVEDNSHFLKGVFPRGFRFRRLSSGFTLLEVMLALAILVGALAVMGEYGRLGMRNAKTSRDLTRAELLCESVITQIAAGVLSTDTKTNESVVDPVTGSPIGEQSDDGIGWVYSIATQEIGSDALLISVTVTVSQSMPTGGHPVSFTLVRWMPNPNASTSSDSGSSGSDSSTSSGSSSTTSTGQ
jgi:prepilin-type N-terminal cleavage/methylation domain-containing protein